MERPDTPELYKFSCIEESYRIIERFLAWLVEKQHITLAEEDPNAMAYENTLVPAPRPYIRYLALYFDLNLEQLEIEKEAFIHYHMQRRQEE